MIQMQTNYQERSLLNWVSTVHFLQSPALTTNALLIKPTVFAGKLKKLRKLDLHDNNLVGTMPREICALKLDVLATDCLGSRPEVRCDCCTICCQGLPDLKCVDVKTGKKVDWSKEK